MSWRKPVVFGFSLGILAWSVVWVLRQLPVRRWGGCRFGCSVGGRSWGVVLITMQRWRGEASHFNEDTIFDSAVWAVMGTTIFFVVTPLVVLLVWSLRRFQGTPAARIAVVGGLLSILVSGYIIGYAMAAVGEAAVAATGQAPETIRFGAAGSAKLAHALTDGGWRS